MLPLAIASALLPWLPVSPPAPTETVDIPRAGAVQSWRLTLYTVRRHEIQLEAGQFLHAILEQKGADVVVTLRGPGGAPIEAGIDVSEGPQGREPASILAGESGVYAIDVEDPDGRGADAYVLLTESPRAPTDADRERLAAERSMVAGGRLMSPRAGDTRVKRRGVSEGRESRRHFREAAVRWERLGDTCWLAEASTFEALHVLWGEQVADTWDGFHRALDLWQSCGNDYKFTEALLFTGHWYAGLSRLPDAARVYDLGLRESREHESPLLAVQFLVALSSTYGLIGDTQAALQCDEEAIPYLRKRGWTEGVAVSLTNQARTYYRRGSLERASELGLESLRLRRQVEWGAGTGTALLQLGDIYLALGEPEVALRYLDEGAAIFEKIGFVSRQAQAATQRAAVLMSMGQRSKALTLLREAVHAAVRGKNERAEMGTRVTLAGALLEQREWVAALAELQDAVVLGERVGDQFLLAEAQELLGRVRLGQGDLALARAALGQALQRRLAIRDRSGEAEVLYLQSQVQQAEGDLDGARELLEHARRIVDEQRALLVSPQLRATWAGTVREIDESYIGLLTEMHRRRPGQGLDALAFEASEGARARSLLDLLAERRDGTSGDSAGDAIARERNVRERLAASLDRQVRALASGKTPAGHEALAQEIRELSAEHERARAELRRTDPRYGAFAQAEPIRLEEVRRLLDPDTALLEFFLGDARSHAWLVTTEGIETYELPGRRRIDAAVQLVRKAVERKPTRSSALHASSALRALSALVLPPSLPARLARLVVVPDGSLHHVPFTALPDADDRPLIRRCEVANAPSASVVALLRRELSGRPRAPRAVAVLADPVYDADDERVASRGAVHRTDPRLVQATRGFGFPNGRLPRLLFTRQEARRLAAQAPATSRVSLDFAANLERGLSEELASYRYVHFATHGLLNDARPELSGLVLSLVDREGRERPGLLTAPDVFHLRLGADLVVLSSCRSALGRELRGEGLVGLTRAFMYAGAPRVMASLWAVDDLATADLMGRTYRGLLGPGRVSAAAALRKAQLEMLGHRTWRAPYYWAAFQVQGEWR
jgi:CHAT domain-containing protein